MLTGLKHGSFFPFNCTFLILCVLHFLFNFLPKNKLDDLSSKMVIVAYANSIISIISAYVNAIKILHENNLHIIILISGLDMQKSCAISDDKAYKKLRNLVSDKKSSQALARNY